MYKKCNFCKWVKPVDSYYVSNQTKCKDCIKKAVTAHRDKNIEAIREYDRARGNRQSPGYLADYRKKNGKKYQAHVLVNNALRKKLIEKGSCEECESTTAIHAHHDDYDKPLDVRWLCAAHHRQWHIENGEGKNGKAA